MLERLYTYTIMTLERAILERLPVLPEECREAIILHLMKYACPSIQSHAPVRNMAARNTIEETLGGYNLK